MTEFTQVLDNRELKSKEHAWNYTHLLPLSSY